MKKLPRFVLVNAPELPQTFILDTRPPYTIAAPYCIPKKDADRVSEFISDIVNGRITAVKVQGFTIFLTFWGSLVPPGPDPLAATAVLTEMEPFYREAFLSKNKHKSRVYEEAVPDDIDEIRGRVFRLRKLK